MSLKERLRHNYHELSKSQKLVYKIFYKHFYGKNSFFYEGVLENPGQMYWRERKAIYETIINHKPNRCFEIGTYNGGGSTYFVSSALHHNNFGKLYTSESDPRLYGRAVDFYSSKLPNQKRFIEFLNSSDFNCFLPFVNEGVDLFILDGAEHARETVDQYEFFMKYTHSGTIMIVHDWHTEKMRLLKDMIFDEWNLLEEINQPHSVGLRIFQFNQ